MRHSIRFLTLSAALLLGACGTMAEGQTQDITLRTPGASEAKCTLDNGLRYPIYKDQTIQIMRSFHPMVVDCYAVGNRHKTITISAGPNPWSAANVANAVVPGTAYDAASMGLYTYPDVITVDFTSTPSQGYELPGYHDRDAVNPYEQSIENMGPKSIRTPGSDEYLERGVERRDIKLDSNPFAGTPLGKAPSSSSSSSGAPAMTPSKEGAGAASPGASGSPKGNTAEELTRSANPTVFNK
jgi:hypothetical protein